MFQCKLVLSVPHCTLRFSCSAALLCPPPVINSLDANQQHHHLHHNHHHHHDRCHHHHHHILIMKMNIPMRSPLICPPSVINSVANQLHQRHHHHHHHEHCHHHHGPWLHSHHYLHGCKLGGAFSTKVHQTRPLKCLLPRSTTCLALLFCLDWIFRMRTN